MLFFQITLKSILTCIFITALFACNGEGEGGNQPPPIPDTTIQGMGFDGPVKNGVVKVYEFNNGLKGREMATAKTDQDGRYVASFEFLGALDKNPILLELSSGSYIDEYSQEEVQLQSGDVLRTVAFYDEGDIVTANITGLTTLATCLSEYYMGEEGAESWDKSITEAYLRVGELVGLNNILNSPLTDVMNRVDPGSEFTEALRHGYILSSFSVMAGKLNNAQEPDGDKITSIKLINSFCKDIQFDGVLDGIYDDDTGNLTIGSTQIDDDFYRDFWASSIFESLDLNLNGANFKRDKIQGVANELSQVNTSLLSSKPYATPQFVVTRINDIDFEDENLESCLNEQKEDFVYELEKLVCSNRNIQNLSGITELTYLRHLDLSSNKIETFLYDEVSDLEYLDLSENFLQQFDFSKHKKLKHAFLLSEVQLEIVNLDGLDELLSLSVNTEYDVNFKSNKNLENLVFHTKERVEPSVHKVLNLSVNQSLINIELVSPSITDIVGVGEAIDLKSLVIHAPLDEIDLKKLVNLKKLSLVNKFGASSFPVNPLNSSRRFFPDTVRELNIGILDLKSNVLLEELEIKEALIANLDISKNVRLTDLSLSGLLIDQLNLSKNTELLKVTVEDINKLTELDLSKNTKLTDVTVSKTDIAALDMSTITQIENVLLNDNSNLSTINWGNSSQIKTILIKDIPINSISLSNFPELEHFEFFGCVSINLDRLCPRELGNFSISNAPKLKTLYVSSEEFDSVLVGDLPSLEDIKFYSVSSSDASSFSISNFPQLKNMEFENTNLTTLDLSLYPLIERAYIKNNKLEDIKIGSLEFLHSLNFDDNPMLGGDVFLDLNTPLLESFSARGANLTEIDFSRTLNLREVYLSGNALSELEFLETMAITKLDVSGNELSELDFSKLPFLEDLDISWNLFRSVELSGHRFIKRLYARNNSISFIRVCAESVNLSHNSMSSFNSSFICHLPAEGAIRHLDLSSNQFVDLEIDVSSYYSLDVSDNLLEQLDIRRLTQLKDLNVEGNSLSDLNISRNVELDKIDVRRNPNLLEVDITQNTLLTSEGIQLDDHTQIVDDSGLDR